MDVLILAFGLVGLLSLPITVWLLRRPVVTDQHLVDLVRLNVRMAQLRSQMDKTSH